MRTRKLMNRVRSIRVKTGDRKPQPLPSLDRAKCFDSRLNKGANRLSGHALEQLRQIGLWIGKDLPFAFNPEFDLVPLMQ